MARGGNRAWRILLARALQAIVAGQSTAQSRDTNPLNPENVLDEIAPLPGAVIPHGVPQSWFDFKDHVYDKIGLRFGFSYQMLGQSASDVAPNATYDTALGHWWGFLTKWTMIDKGGEYEGVLGFSMFERAAVGNNAVPSNFGLADVGSLTTSVELSSGRRAQAPDGRHPALGASPLPPAVT